MGYDVPSGGDVLFAVEEYGSQNDARFVSYPRQASDGEEDEGDIFSFRAGITHS